MGVNKKVLISVIHGTYGHQDDNYGALLLANGILSKGGEATLYLKGDGVYLAIKNQNPNDIGFPNNLDELSDFVDLGGAVKLDRKSLSERGLVEDDLVKDVEIIETENFLDLLAEHDLIVDF
jgi:sulfur relay (sulfurtransferase) DsrF/TusC family protein